MHSANSERPAKGALHPIQESAQTALAVSEISKGLQCALTAITIVALWRLLHLGHNMCAIYIYIYILAGVPGVARVNKVTISQKKTVTSFHPGIPCA